MLKREESIRHRSQWPYMLGSSKNSVGGQRILDTHLGSGSSRIAAYRAGLDFYGCELDKGYFDKMNERFEKECHGVEVINGHTIIQNKLF